MHRNCLCFSLKWTKTRRYESIEIYSLTWRASNNNNSFLVCIVLVNFFLFAYVSLQISLIDRRPPHPLLKLCKVDSIIFCLPTAEEIWRRKRKKKKQTYSAQVYFALKENLRTCLMTLFITFPNMHEKQCDFSYKVLFHFFFSCYKLVKCHLLRNRNTSESENAKLNERISGTQ